MAEAERGIPVEGLSPRNLKSDAHPSIKHSQLFASYLLNLKRGPKVVRNMIDADIECFRDLGAHAHACDLLTVRERFVAEFAEIEDGPPSCP